MPFVRDTWGNSPMHECSIKEDFKSCNALLTYLQKAPIDHHGRAISNILPLLIKKEEVPAVISYFDNRFKETF